MRKKLIFLTRSTTPSALSNFTFNTSSQAYEVNLISSLASMIDLTVVHIGKADNFMQSTSRRPFKVELFEGSVEYCFFGPLTPFACIRFSNFLNELTRGLEGIIVTSGYYLYEMICLTYLKSDLLKTYAIVFDTHIQGNSSMPLPKRWLANIYFEIGFFLLRHLSGIVVLNDGFILSNKIQIRHHKTKIGKLFYGKKDHIAPIKTSNDPVRLLFAGTLNADNGVRLILTYMDHDRSQNIELTFFGYGELQNEIKNRELVDSRITYGGILNDRELDEVLINYDYLICLRDPQSVVCQYAFPSKLIKFMGSGVPVICNVFPGLDPEYQKHLLLLKEYSVAGFADVMTLTQRKEYDLRVLGAMSRKHIETHHSWSTISAQMIDFLTDAPNCNLH